MYCVIYDELKRIYNPSGRTCQAIDWSHQLSITQCGDNVNAKRLLKCGQQKHMEGI